MDELSVGAGEARLKIQINRYREIFITFTDTNISAWTFEFFLQKNWGDRLKVFSLTLGSGISFVTYTDSIKVVITAAQSNIEEGEYTWQLVRTDLNVTLLNGPASVSYNAPQ